MSEAAGLPPASSHPASHGPDNLSLLQAVAAFLRDTAILQLPAAHQLEARIALSLVETVQRDMVKSPPANVLRRARLQALLAPWSAQTNAQIADSAVAVDDLEALNAQLCHRIAAGDFSLDDPALLHHLWQSTWAQLAVDQPGYRQAAQEVARMGQTGGSQ